MKKNNNQCIATEVLSAVGGASNITFVTHCMTRLRFNLKDMSIPNEENIKAIPGVLGVVQSGGQFQIVIGQNVAKVYSEICKTGNFQEEDQINENPDHVKEKTTPKKIFNNILNYCAGSLTPIIPILMAAGMLKTVLVIFGDLLGWIPVKSDTYVLLNFVYNAGFYFMPIYVGYTAAKKLNVTPVLGMFMGGILISPAFVKMVTDGTSFTVLGISIVMKNYSSTILPILLSIWIMSYIEKLLKKIMPDSLTTIFTPTLTILFMLPLSFLILAPAGYVIGDYLSIVLNALGTYGGFIAIAIIAALWEYLVMSGMHIVLVMPAMATLMAGGSDPVIFVAGKCATFAACGMAFGTFLRMKNKQEKATNFGFLIAGILGGVTEPVLYGTGFKYKRPFLGMSIGAAIGGLYAGITGVTANLLASSNILGVLAFSGKTAANLVNGIIACSLAFICSTIAVFILGYNKEETETGIARS